MSLMDRCLTGLIEGTVRKKTSYASKIELKYGTLVWYQGTVRRYSILQKLN